MRGLDFSGGKYFFRKRSQRDFYSLSGGQCKSKNTDNGSRGDAFRDKREPDINKQEKVISESSSSGTKWLILGLTLVITAAVYINWKFVSSGAPYVIAQTTEGTAVTGNTSYVTSESDSYFDNAKYLRKKNRDEAVSVLSELVDNINADETSRRTAAAAITGYVQTSEKEQQIENLIKAKGFRECIVFLGDNNATVVVESDGLTSAQAAQIMDITSSETGFSFDVIKIIEIGSVQN